MVFGPESSYTRHLGAYLSIFRVDNILNLRDRAILYNEPGRAAAMFTVRENRRAKALLMFRADRLEVDLRDEVAQKLQLWQRFSSMSSQTPRLLAAMRTRMTSTSTR
jgi:hypothetical protein